MNLIEELDAAIEARNKSRLPEFEIQAKVELEPLLAAGQKNYAAQVIGRLETLRRFENPILTVLVNATGHPPITQ